jgi:hypothetical protein
MDKKTECRLTHGFGRDEKKPANPAQSVAEESPRRQHVYSDFLHPWDLFR